MYFRVFSSICAIFIGTFAFGNPNLTVKNNTSETIHVTLHHGGLYTEKTQVRGGTEGFLTTPSGMNCLDSVTVKSGNKSASLDLATCDNTTVSVTNPNGNLKIHQ